MQHAYRSYRKDLWRMASPSRGVKKQRQSTYVALSLPMRDGARNPSPSSCRGTLKFMRLQETIVAYWHDLWQAHSARQSQGTAQMAVSLRVRNGRDCPIPRTHEPLIVRLSSVCSSVQAQNQTWHGRQQATHGVDGHAATMWKSGKQVMAGLWGPRHQNLRTLAGFRTLLGGHGADLPRRFVYRAHKQRWRLRTIQLHMDPHVPANEESPEIERSA